MDRMIQYFQDVRKLKKSVFPIFPGYEKVEKIIFQYFQDYRECWRLQFPIFPGFEKLEKLRFPIFPGL